MATIGAFDISWWITVVELPALAGLFWLVLKIRQENHNAISDLKQTSHYSEDKLWHALNAYKLDVAKTYASIQTLKEVEQRLTDHLVRIEDKLDGAFGINQKGGPRHE